MITAIQPTSGSLTAATALPRSDRPVAGNGSVRTLAGPCSGYAQDRFSRCQVREELDESVYRVRQALQRSHLLQGSLCKRQLRPPSGRIRSTVGQFRRKHQHLRHDGQHGERALRLRISGEFLFISRYVQLLQREFPRGNVHALTVNMYKETCGEKKRKRKKSQQLRHTHTHAPLTLFYLGDNNARFSLSGYRRKKFRGQSLFFFFLSNFYDFWP